MSDLDSVKWPKFTSYGELDRTAAKAHILAPETFVGGPFAQFVRLAADQGESRGARARTMQFAKRRYSVFRAGLAETTALELDRLIASCLDDLRADSNNAWLLDVWDGRLGHHGV